MSRKCKYLSISSLKMLLGGLMQPVRDDITAGYLFLS